MKILIITGSPHKTGTSNTLAACFAKGAEEAGHKVKFYDAARGNIKPCLGCDRCGMAGDCVQKDDGNAFLEELLSSDAVVFATPVYYFTMSAQLKTVIDRFYARNGAITRKQMKAVLLATAWNDDNIVMKGISMNFDIIFDYLNFTDCGRVLAKGSGTVSMMPDLYQPAQRTLDKPKHSDATIFQNVGAFRLCRLALSVALAVFSQHLYAVCQGRRIFLTFFFLGLDF